MKEAKVAPENPGESVLREMHQTFLQALRQREQEIFSYLTTLGLAFGGFGWLLVQEYSKQPPTSDIPFSFGTVGVQVLLWIGGVYALVLGYNYRYITFQLAKIERFLKIENVMLNRWPGSVKEFEKYTRWCDPPEIIKLFWIALTMAILFVTGFAAKVRGSPLRIWVTGGILFLLSFLVGPVYFGRRFKGVWEKEQESDWPTSASEKAESAKV